MWTHCQSSCIAHSQDDDERCKDWCDEGECEANPNYILFHCPKCCANALAWNPWARQSIGIEPFLDHNYIKWVAVESCSIPQDLLAAAQMMKTRLVNYIKGGASAVSGLSFDAPNQFLGIYGLVEALIYTLRLYKVVSVEQLSETSQSKYDVLISDIEDNILQAHYRSDLLTRKLPSWIQSLSEFSAQDFVDQNEKNTNDQNTCKISDSQLSISISNLPQRLKTQTRNNFSSGFKMSNLHDKNFIKLANGVFMPAVGLGTWKLNNEDCEQTMKKALDIGYRHFDTAQAYRNEQEVGNVIASYIRSGEVKRDDLFIATKLSDYEETLKGQDYYGSVRNLVKQQLQMLQVDYIDLYMLHSPIQNKQIQSELWRCIEDLLSEGVFKSIGVSNFDERELRNMLEHPSAIRVMPMVIQNKYDVYHAGKQLDNEGDSVVKYAASKGIVLVSYSPFSSYPFTMEPVEDPLIRSIAARLFISPAQVILKWILQQGHAVIPRSTNSENLKLNLDSTNRDVILSESDMELLNTLSYLTSSPISKYVPFD